MWEVVGSDVVNLIQSFFRHKTPLWPKLTKPFRLFLIPKIERAQGIKDFRPISLSNAIYKIVAKVLTNRLKNYLTIGPFQSAFVRGRNLSVNYIVVHKILHSFKKKTKNKFLGLKLHMVKAYDRMEWDFIFHTLDAFGFHMGFIRIIREWITDGRGFSSILGLLGSADVRVCGV